MYSMKTVLIGRGQNGWHAQSTNGSDITGSSSGGTLEHYLLEAEDGTAIYDCNDANYKEFSKFVFSGPLCSPTLPSGTVRTFKDQETLIRMLPGFRGTYEHLTVMNLVGLSSFDSVSVDVYISLLRAQVSGAKIGTVQNHTIVWE
jgi:hypothetical protein